jgi:tRNA G26 N,N-dimethylase Trm1
MAAPVKEIGKKSSAGGPIWRGFIADPESVSQMIRETRLLAEINCLSLPVRCGHFGNWKRKQRAI